MPTWRNFSANVLALLSETVDRLAALLGALEGEPAPLDGGITNRNYRARFGGRDVVCGCRARTPSCSGSTAGRARGEPLRGRGRRRARGGGAARRPALPGHRASSRAPTMERGGAARAGGAGRGRRARCARSTAASRSAPRFAAFRIVEDYAAKATRARGGEVPAAYERAAARPRRGSRRRCAGARARAGPLPQRPAGRQLHPLRGRHPDRRLGVRGDGRPLLRPRQLRRQQRARRAPRRRRCLTAYFGEPPTAAPARRAAPDALHVRLPRGDVGRSCRAPLSDLDFDFAGYAAKHFERLADGRSRPALRGPARGGRRCRELSCPTRPAA